MAARLTTHALDTQRGCAAVGLVVELRHADGNGIINAVLDTGGRATLAEDLASGVYELTFSVADYHRALGVALAEPPFLDKVTLRFGVAEGEAHYHVPLVFTPWSYQTYRGG